MILVGQRTTRSHPKHKTKQFLKATDCIVKFDLRKLEVDKSHIKISVHDIDYRGS